ncbi:MAG: c-type cytochrome [Piscinibacter sp.]|nr:c-type cytochrome [Piscinibacter sp.]
MKTALSTLLGAVALAAALPAGATDAQVARGKYLVDTAGCHDCHTPFKMGPNGPEKDMSHMLAGHPEALVMPPVPKLPDGPWMAVSAATNTAHAGPWGVSFTANLTPDAETGLGDWTLRDFVSTIRTGRHLGRGRAVLPPMPIPAYSHFSDADLEAIYRYLRTIPAVKNKVPEPWAPQAAAAATK